MWSACNTYYIPGIVSNRIDTEVEPYSDEEDKFEVTEANKDYIDSSSDSNTTFLVRRRKIAVAQ